MFPISILNKKFLQFLLSLIFLAFFTISLYLSNALSKSSEEQKFLSYQANYNFLINQRLNKIEDQISFLSSKVKRLDELRGSDFPDLNIDLIYSRVEANNISKDNIIWQKNSLSDPQLSQIFISSSNALIEASKRFLGKPLFGSLIHFPKSKNLPVVITLKSDDNAFETIAMWLDVDSLISEINLEYQKRYNFQALLTVAAAESKESIFSIDRIPTLNLIIKNMGAKNNLSFFNIKIYYNTMIVAILNMIIAALLLILISQTFTRFSLDNFKYLSFWNQEIKDKLLSVREISSSIAHELNQPLAAAEIFVSTMQIELSKEQINKKEILSISDNISQQIQRSSKIIKSMSALSKNSVPEINSHNLLSLFSGLMPLISLQAKENNSSVKIEIDQDLNILVDKIAFEQIALNISRNAFQSMNKTNKEKKALHISASLKKGAKSFFSEDKVTITFSDNGVGINDEMATKIFEPFYTENKDGVGLGLNIVKSLVEQNRGRISFSTNPIGGCDFIVELPNSNNEAKQ